MNTDNQSKLYLDSDTDKVIQMQIHISVLEAQLAEVQKKWDEKKLEEDQKRKDDIEAEIRKAKDDLEKQKSADELKKWTTVGEIAVGVLVFAGICVKTFG